ncbi:MAG: hypothetical protein ACLVJH_07290 [Faecalibacterium prausnitzii]
MPPQTATLTHSAARCGQSWQCTRPCPQQHDPLRQRCAADLIFRLVWAAKPPHGRCCTAPTFAEYAAALETAGCTVRRHILRKAKILQ